VLKPKYLFWVTSPEGKAPCFQRRHPKHVGRIMRDLGRDDKVVKRLPVRLDVSELEILLAALDKANRDFEAPIKAYQDPANRNAHCG